MSASAARPRRLRVGGALAAAVLAKCRGPLHPCAHDAARLSCPADLAPALSRALPVAATCAELDVSVEVLESCLSFLQADPEEPFLAALPNAAAMLDVRFHR